MDSPIFQGVHCTIEARLGLYLAGNRFVAGEATAWEENVCKISWRLVSTLTMANSRLQRMQYLSCNFLIDECRGGRSGRREVWGGEQQNATQIGPLKPELKRRRDRLVNTSTIPRKCCGLRMGSRNDDCALRHFHGPFLFLSRTCSESLFFSKKPATS